MSANVATKNSPCLRAGITRAFDPLLWVPKRFEDYTRLIGGTDIASHLEQEVCLQVTITAKGRQENGSFTIQAEDSIGAKHYLKIFGNYHVSPWKTIPLLSTVWVRAKVVEYNTRHYFNRVELVDESKIGTIAPVYTGKPGIIGRDAIFDLAQSAVRDANNVQDAASWIRQNFNGLSEEDIFDLAGARGSLSILINNLHRPKTMMAGNWAIQTAKAIAVAYIRHAAKQATVAPINVDSIIRIEPDQLNKLAAQIPFPLTKGHLSQVSAIKEIAGLLEAPYPMNALLSADVGTGKTICYGLIAAAAQRLGKRVAVLIPNTILANQAGAEIRDTFAESHVVITHEKMKASDIPWHANPILVGTTKLFGLCKKQGWIPDLLIVDEQQKTDEKQRRTLCGPHTNVLETTATPISRSMALLEHGNKSLIQIEAQHADKKISTEIISNHPADRAALFGDLKKAVAAGDQIVIVYPKVAGSSANDMASVTTMQELWERNFPGQTIVLHGKMTDAEKIAVMERIRNRDVQIIITTVILEIGITIKNLRHLMIVRPDRVGVFTLHQLRGRLVRNGGEGRFLMYLQEAVKDETRERLDLLCQTNSGFELAQLVMERNGFGELANADGTQSGKTPTLFTGIKLMPADFQ